MRIVSKVYWLGFTTKGVRKNLVLRCHPNLFRDLTRKIKNHDNVLLF